MISDMQCVQKIANANIYIILMDMVKINLFHMVDSYIQS